MSVSNPSGGGGAIDSAVQTNRIGNALYAPALAPDLRAPGIPALSRKIDFGRTGHGFAKNGVPGTVSDDTAVFVNGSQSIKMLTAGDAVEMSINNQTITAFSLSAGFLRIKFRVDILSRLNYVGVLLGDGVNIVQNLGLVGALSGASVINDGEWMTLHLSKDDFAASSVNFAAITRIMVRVKDNGGGLPVTVNVQHMDVVPNPANGCIALCFDDGWATQYTVAKPYMDKYGFKGNTAIIRDQISANGGGLYMGIAQLLSLHDDSGWDVMAHADLIASHNQTNGLVDLSTTDGTATAFSTFEREIAALKGWLVANGFRGRDFLVWPLGKFTTAHITIARKYFAAMRTFRTNLNTFEADTYPFADPLRLRQMAVTNGGSAEVAATVNTAVDNAMTAKKTLLLTFHGIGSQSWEYPTASFQSVIDNIATKGYRVKTLTEIFTEGVA